MKYRMVYLLLTLMPFLHFQPVIQVNSPIISVEENNFY